MHVNALPHDIMHMWWKRPLHVVVYTCLGNRTGSGLPGNTQDMTSATSPATARPCTAHTRREQVAIAIVWATRVAPLGVLHSNSPQAGCKHLAVE